MSATRNKFKYVVNHRGFQINTFHRTINTIIAFVHFALDWEARSEFVRDIRRIGERFAKSCTLLENESICVVEEYKEGSYMTVQFYFKHKEGLDKRKLLEVYQKCAEEVADYINNNAPPEAKVCVKAPFHSNL